MAENDVFKLLSHEYYQFTASEKRVADFIISNSTVAQTMSISDLADASGVAGATISRFCRRLGYDSFAAFKLAIATSAASRASLSNPLVGEVTQEDTLPTLARKLAGANIDAILETEALIRPTVIQSAADILLQADKVLCMGQGGSMLMAQEAAHLFSTSFSGFFSMADSHMQLICASQLNHRDAILYFSYSGTTNNLMEVLRIAKSRNTPLLLVTRFPNSPGASQADVVLECGSRESPLQLGSVPARMAQLYLIDVLYSEVCRRDLEGCRQRRIRVADALSEQHI